MPVTMQTLKAASRRLVKAAGGQESCALVEGIGNERHQYFSEVGNVAHPTRFLRIDQVALLEADCGQPEVTRELARASGHVLVPIPRPLAGEMSNAALSSVARESGDFLAKWIEAHADGRVTPDEVAVLRGHCARLIEAAAQLDQNLKHHGGGE